jgi:hypothetical protein
LSVDPAGFRRQKGAMDTKLIPNAVVEVRKARFGNA